MSTPSKNASARKGKRAPWPPEKIAAWMRAQPPSPAGLGTMTRGTERDVHNRLAQALRNLPHDPNPIPISSLDTPLLP